MTRSHLSLPGRIALAFGSFFRILFEPAFAAAIERLQTGPMEAAPVAPAPAKPAVPAVHAVPEAAALQLLGLLQRDGRFVDFIEEDVTAYADADIGAAARVVHEGCRKVLREHFTIGPVRSESEGSRITLAAGFDAASVRLTGNVVGEPPFSGSLGHRGWRVTESRLPRIADGHDPSILAQAEVEL